MSDAAPQPPSSAVGTRSAPTTMSLHCGHPHPDHISLAPLARFEKQSPFARLETTVLRRVRIWRVGLMCTLRGHHCGAGIYPDSLNEHRQAACDGRVLDFRAVVFRGSGVMEELCPLFLSHRRRPRRMEVVCNAFSPHAIGSSPVSVRGLSGVTSTRCRNRMTMYPK